jgi:hypothetical protein
VLHIVGLRGLDLNSAYVSTIQITTVTPHALHCMHEQIALSEHSLGEHRDSASHQFGAACNNSAGLDVAHYSLLQY